MAVMEQHTQPKFNKMAAQMLQVMGLLQQVMAQVNQLNTERDQAREQVYIVTIERGLLSAIGAQSHVVIAKQDQLWAKWAVGQADIAILSTEVASFWHTNGVTVTLCMHMDLMKSNGIESYYRSLYYEVVPEGQRVPSYSQQMMSARSQRPSMLYISVEKL